MNIGFIFKDDENYSTCAQWCNENNAHIEEIEKDENGERRFQIIELPKPSQDELDLQKTTAKQSELQAQLDELMTAHNQAVMLGNTELAEQLKTEYQSLVNGNGS